MPNTFEDAMRIARMIRLNVYSELRNTFNANRSRLDTDHIIEYLDNLIDGYERIT